MTCGRSLVAFRLKKTLKIYHGLGRTHRVCNGQYRLSVSHGTQTPQVKVHCLDFLALLRHLTLFSPSHSRLNIHEKSQMQTVLNDMRNDLRHVTQTPFVEARLSIKFV